MTACFIPAPIDETPEPENLPPTVDQRLDIFPADQREVFIELDFANPEPFGVRRVSDPNEEQTLYWRALVDYGAQVISSPTTTIDGDERELVQQFQFKPCEFPYRGAGEGATNLLLFFVVADEPFEDETSFFFGEDRLESATRTIGERPVEMVVWGVTLVGACRDF